MELESVKTKPNQLHITAIFVTLLIGSALRLTRLGYQSEWNDEAISVVIASGSVRQILTNQFHSRHPPGYYLLLHYWQEWFGDNDFALRLLSAIAGIASIYTIYLLGKALFTTQTGIWAAIITALMPFHLFYSQEIRVYSLLFLLSTFVLLSQVKVWQEDRKWWWFFYLITALSGLYMHYLFTLIIGVVGLYFILRRWYTGSGPSWLSFLVTHSMMGILYIPVLRWAWAETGGATYWIEEAGLAEFFSMPLALSIGQFLDFVPIMIGYGLILTLVLIILLQAGRAIYQKVPETPGLILILMTYWLPVSLLFIVATVWTPLTTPRLMTVAVPGLYLMLAWSATMTKEKWFNTALVLALLLVGMLANYNWLFVERFQKIPVREAAHFLQDTADPNEKILYANDSGFRLFNRYAPTMNHNLYLDVSNEHSNPRVRPETIQLMGGGIVTPHDALTGKFWLVLHFDFDIELQKDIFNQFETRYQQIDFHDVGGILMVHYQVSTE